MKGSVIMRENKLLGFVKKYWIFAMIIATVIIVASVVAYAYYEGDHDKVKRVIATGSQKGQLFTSDLLEAGSTPIYLKAIDNTSDDSEDESEENAATTNSVAFQIWNWNPMNPTVPYEVTLKYTLSATLTDKNGNPLKVTSETASDPLLISNLIDETFSIDVISADTHTSILSSPLTNNHISDPGAEATFTANTKATQKYEVVLSNNLADKGIYVTLIADPDDTLNKELDSLSVAVGLTEETQGLDSGWYGSFVEESGTAQMYDGFNYTISGNGEEYLYLYWRSDLLTINPWFLQDSHYDTAIMDDSDSSVVKVETSVYPTGVTTGTWSRLKLHVNSDPMYFNSSGTRVDSPVTDGKTIQLTRYDIQFYIKDYDTYSSAESWSWATMQTTDRHIGFALVEKATS